MKSLIGLVLGLLIGAACRWFEIPVPAPPKLIGALLVLAITIGYLAADHVLADRGIAETKEASSVR